MSLRVVITGVRGRIGGSLVELLSKRSDVVVMPMDRRQLPLDDPDGAAAALDALDFDVLLNPAAMTHVDECEHLRDMAMAVNALTPGRMAEVCRTRGARMIHVSTDYVFDGVAEGMIGEDAEPRPLGEYGRTKLEGERLVLAAGPGHMVVRTSWVFGPAKPGFPDMVLSRARDHEHVEFIADKWSSPCYSDDFAKWMELLLIQHPEAAGIFHLCNSGLCSWQEYAQGTVDIALELGMNLMAKEVGGLALKDMKNFISPRPVHSALSCGRFIQLTGHTPRPWQDAMRDYLTRQAATAPFGS